MSTATLTKPKAKRTPRQPLPRRLQHIVEVPGNIHLFACYSMTRTGKEVKHVQDIDLHTLEGRCSCEDFSYRRARYLPKISKPDGLCKHLTRCVDWLVRNGKWEPATVAEQRCSQCGMPDAKHELCDDSGNPMPGHICADCVVAVRRMQEERPEPPPEFTPDDVPDYEPEVVLEAESDWGDGDINDIHQAVGFVAMHSGRNLRFVTRCRSSYQECYRAAAKKLHPDNGGSTIEFQQLQQAAAIIKKVYGV